MSNFLNDIGCLFDQLPEDLTRSYFNEGDYEFNVIYGDEEKNATLVLVVPGSDVGNVLLVTDDGYVMCAAGGFRTFFEEGRTYTPAEFEKQFDELCAKAGYGAFKTGS